MTELIKPDDKRLKGKKSVPLKLEIPLEALNLVKPEKVEFATEPLKLAKKSGTSIRISTETLIYANEIKKFYDAYSLEEILKHGLVALIDKSLIRTHDRETIEKLCKLRKQLSPKIP